ncbi:TPA: hypothetical protein OTS68_001070 [Enterobacter hormaechei]|nr:hypothetical protein [Enterobacter hormaechei]
MELSRDKIKEIINDDWLLMDDCEGNKNCDVVKELARIALASLEAEPVAIVEPSDYVTAAQLVGEEPRSKAVRPLFEGALSIGQQLYTAPQPLTTSERAELENYRNACRAAMLQGADNELQRKSEIHDALCAKYNVESLADFVDWQRNHIAELEAAPPAPVGEGETAVMPDYPGYVMTQRECFQAGAKKAVPDGWVAVPIEPTYQMCEVMGLPWESPRFPDRYKAMLAAAPQQKVK